MGCCEEGSLHSRLVSPKLAMDGRAIDTEKDTDVDGCPARRWSMTVRTIF